MVPGLPITIAVLYTSNRNWSPPDDGVVCSARSSCLSTGLGERSFLTMLPTDGAVEPFTWMTVL